MLEHAETIIDSHFRYLNSRASCVPSSACNCSFRRGEWWIILVISRWDIALLNAPLLAPHLMSSRLSSE